MRGRPSCLLQFAGAEANRILLASALSSMRIICPNKVSQRDWMIAVSLGCFVSLCTSSFRTNWYHLMPSSIRRHHWSSASILRASVLDMSVCITIMPTTPTSLLFTSLLSQSTRLTLMNNTRPSGGSCRSIVGRTTKFVLRYTGRVATKCHTQQVFRMASCTQASSPLRHSLLCSERQSSTASG